MRKNNGQALVEFILILPVLIMFIFSIIDFGSIMIRKNEIENELNDMVLALDDNELDEVENKFLSDDINVSLTYDDKKYLTIKVESDIKIITPGLNLIIGNPYKVSCERVVLYEKK